MYLICDFDGTLIKNDFFEERFFGLLLEQPLLIVQYAFKNNGLLNLKHKLLDNFSPEYNLDFLFNQELVDWVKANRNHYLKVLLISASPDRFVKRIVEPMAIFDNVHGSLNDNLKGKRKLHFIKELGITQFVYIGDSFADRPIFDAASKAYLITSNGIKKIK
jgi:phosphoserine phosphatase